MRIFEVEGDSVEEIVAHFMKEKDVPSDYIKYEVMEQGSKGLFGLGKKTAKVKISYNEVEHVKKKGKLLLNELLEKAGFADAHVTAENNDNSVRGNRRSTGAGLFSRTASDIQGKNGRATGGNRRADRR